MPAFRKEHIDALFGEIRGQTTKRSPSASSFTATPTWPFALHDAGRDIPGEIDDRVVDLVNRHKALGQSRHFRPRTTMRNPALDARDSCVFR